MCPLFTASCYNAAFQLPARTDALLYNKHFMKNETKKTGKEQTNSLDPKC